MGCRGDAVGRSAGLLSWIDAQNLAEEGVRVLTADRLAVGVLALAVAHGDIEVPVGAEGELAAVVVVAVRVMLEEDQPPGGRVGQVGVGRRPPVLEHLEVAVGPGGRHEYIKQATGRVVGSKRHRAQSPLHLCVDVRDGQERGRLENPVRDHADCASPLDHEQPWILRWGRCVHRRRSKRTPDRDERLASSHAA
jgi:uncharacterized protein (DUF111 family)